MINDLVLEPVGGDFDLAAISVHLESMKTVVRDPVDTEQFLMASDSLALREGVAERHEHPGRVSYSLTVIAPTPRRILLAYRNMDTVPARAFVRWLRSQRDIRILDQDFNDFTEEATRDLDFIFGPERSACSQMIERVNELIEEYDIGLYALDDVQSRILSLSLLHSIDDIISALPEQWRVEFVAWARERYDNDTPTNQFVVIGQGLPSDDDLKPIAHIREWFRRHAEHL